MTIEGQSMDLGEGGERDQLMDALKGMDDGLVRDLTGKKLSTKGSKWIGALGPVGAILLADVVSAARLYAEDPQQIDRSVKVVRAAVNAMIQMSPTNTAPIVSSDPWVIAAGAAGGLASLFAVGYVGKKVADVYTSISSKREAAREAARARLVAGNEQVNKTNHTVVVWFEQNDLVSSVRNLLTSPVLLSNGVNPYDELNKNEYPPIPVHVTGESGDDETLHRANITKANELLLLPLSTDDLLVPENDKTTVLQDRMKRALDIAVSAIQIHHTENPAAPFDIILVAPKDFQLTGSEMESQNGVITPAVSIDQYLKVFASKYGIPKDVILNHFHIIDPGDLLAESLGEFTEKKIAIAGDERVRAVLGTLLRTHGFHVAPYSKETEYVITYDRGDQNVVIHPAILTGAQQSLGYFVDEEGGRVDMDSAQAEPVSVHDRRKDVEGEVLFSQPVDFESALQKALSDVHQNIEERNNDARGENRPAIKRITISENDIQSGGLLSVKDEEFRGRALLFLKSVQPLIQMLENGEFPPEATLSQAVINPVIYYQNATEIVGFIPFRQIGAHLDQRIEGPLKIKQSTHKHETVYQVTWQQKINIKYLKTGNSGYSNRTFQVTCIVDSYGALRLKSSKMLRESKRFDGKKISRVARKREDQLGIMYKMQAVLLDWYKEKGIPIDSIPTVGHFV